MTEERKPGTFKKGDPRINRKGRPRSFDALRELAQQIGHEPLAIGDKKLTVTEAILRQWAQSKNPQLQRAFIEIAYGKVPDIHNINFGNMSDDQLREFIKTAIGIGGAGNRGSEATWDADSDSQD